MQVSKLKTEVTRIKAEGAKRNRQSASDGRGVLEQVTNLQSALDDAKGGQEQLRMHAKNADMQREAASRKEAELIKEVDRLQNRLQAAEAEVDKLRQQARSLRGQRVHNRAAQADVLCPCSEILQVMATYRHGCEPAAELMFAWRYPCA